MKREKIFSTVLVLIITVFIITLFTSCGLVKSSRATLKINSDVQKNEAVNEAFPDQKNDVEFVQGVLDKLKGIDLKKKLEKLDSYEKKTEEDKDSSTSIDSYYDNTGKKVYDVYNGYGEECWTEFLTIGSDETAQAVEVSYYGDGGSAYTSVDVTYTDKTGTYSVTYSEFSADSYYGARSISVCFKKPATRFSQSILYGLTFSDNDEYNLTMQNAYYIKDDGTYCAYTPDAEDTSPERVIIGKFDGVFGITKNSNILKESMAYAGVTDINILMGQHTPYFDSNGYYVKVPVFLVFKDADSANAYVKQFGFTVSTSIDDKYSVVEIPDVTIKLAKDCDYGTYKSFDYMFAGYEWNDYIYKTITLNDNAEITSFDTSKSNLQYY